MDKITKVVNLNEKEARYYESCLHNSEFHDFDTATYTVCFNNNIEMDIKVCGSDDGEPWTEAVLFKNGYEVACSDVDEEFFGEWSLEYDGTIYEVILNKQ